MRIDGKWADVRICNISSRGLLLQSAEPPSRGSYIEIFKAKHTIVARVVWTKNQQFGIHTRERLDVGALINEAAPANSTAPPRSSVPTERRANPRGRTAEGVVQRLERSRQISTAIEFGAIVVCGVVAAMIMVGAVYETLSRPFQDVSRSLLKR